MRWMQSISHWLRSLLRRRTVERELGEEVRFHLERQIEENISSGMPPEEARLSALREFGGVEQVKEQCREMRNVDFIDDLLRDLVYAGRTLRRSPGFATLAVLIMALGIGANTAVFSVVNTVLLKPLSYPDPDRIVTLTNPLRTGEVPTALSVKLVSIPNFQDWHDQSSSFEAMAYYRSFEAAMMTGAAAEYAQATKVSPEFFRTFSDEQLFIALSARNGLRGLTSSAPRVRREIASQLRAYL